MDTALLIARLLLAAVHPGWYSQALRPQRFSAGNHQPASSRPLQVVLALGLAVAAALIPAALPGGEPWGR